jgi:hypothetical protein
MGTDVSASKFRLRIILPIVQVAVTAVLTWWGDRVNWVLLGGRHSWMSDRLVVFKLQQIWVGLNAPTFPFCFFSGTPIRSLFGLGRGEILHLGSVAVLWYLVGRFLDRWISVEVLDGQSPSARSGIISMLLLGWGIVLLAVSVLNLKYSFPLVENHTIYWTLSFLARERPYILVRHILFLLWSLILIASPVTKLGPRIGRSTERP